MNEFIYLSYKHLSKWSYFDWRLPKYKKKKIQYINLHRLHFYVKNNNFSFWFHMDFKTDSLHLLFGNIIWYGHQSGCLSDTYFEAFFYFIYIWSHFFSPICRSVPRSCHPLRSTSRLVSWSPSPCWPETSHSPSLARGTMSVSSTSRARNTASLPCASTAPAYSVRRPWWV